MPAKLEWANPEKTILMGTAKGDIPKEEFANLVEQEMAVIASVDHPVDIIADLREVERVSMDLLALSATFARQIPPNLRGIALVGTNPILEAIFGVWSKIHKKITMVKTLKQAYMWIWSLDQQTSITKN